jgi:hypothetical protein
METDQAASSRYWLLALRALFILAGCWPVMLGIAIAAIPVLFCLAIAAALLELLRP